MERADDMEEIFFKGVRGGLVLHAGIVVVKHAFFAGAGRADVAAGIAADAAGELIAPEGEALLRRHALQPLDFGKAGAVLFLALLADQLVEADDFLALAGFALAEQHVRAVQRNVAVDRPGGERIAAVFDGGHTGSAAGLDFFNVAHAFALHADGVDVFAQNAVLLEKLHKGIGVAGLEKDRDFSALAGFRNQIFGQICTGKHAVDEVLFCLGGVGKDRRRQVIEEFAGLPAEDAIHFAGGQQRKRPFFYSLHRRSSSFRFSPSAATVCTNSFIVAANFAPSAAETHSTRVRSRSMPR